MSERSGHALRVAIAGQGPKGLYALERLIAGARRLPRDVRIAVDVYEPHPAPGAGPVYDPAQPDFLRMNFAAGQVDMWTAEDRGGPSFVEWRRETPGEGGDVAYPPRSQVGRYLTEGFAQLVQKSGESVSVSVIPTPATEVKPDGGGTWSVASDGAVAGYDEVLVAVGHAPSWDGALAEARPDPSELVPAVFPVGRWLTPERVAPGARVAIRGFALTMIDAALALTEGRGGSFKEGREPYLLAYAPGESEVGAIHPYSRSGRPMLAKPDPTLAEPDPALERIAEEACALLGEARADVGRLAETVATVAEASLDAVAPGKARSVGALDRLEAAADGRIPPSERSVADELEASIALGVGEGEPGLDWALGHAWRSVYPAIVASFGGDSLADGEWPRFRFLAAEMERLAFGPPPVNAAKLLALIEAGKVMPAPAGALDAEVTVDGVLPGPGALGVHHPLLQQLVRDGHARVRTGRRGLELTDDVTCVGASGEPSSGLGAMGRPTEDWVIGNDTLSRELHPHPAIWAARVVERAERL